MCRSSMSPARRRLFIIVQDGPGYTGKVSAALDNLIAAKRLPVMVAIMIASGGGDSKGSERGWSTTPSLTNTPRS